MKPLIDWLDHRAGARTLLQAALYEHIPGGARWRYVWGSTLVFAFVVQVITGVFLWMAYSPSTQTAWESVFYIQYEMQGGWLLRGLHHFMAQAMIVLLVLHLMQVVIDGAYKAPREVNFWLGLVLMQIVLGLSLTGYLLPWDQKGYSATKVATNIMSHTPVIGPTIQRLVVGGADYGHHTLTRFFALHAGVLPGLLIGFLVLHVALFRRHGIHAVKPQGRPDGTFWPDQVLKDAVACLAVLAVVLFLVYRGAITGAPEATVPGEYLGTELGAPADVGRSYSAARPEWYFLFLFQFLKYIPSEQQVVGEIVVPGVVLGVMFLMPFLGRWKLGHAFNVLYLLVVLGAAGALTVQAMIHDYGDEHFREAVAETEMRAERARELAMGPNRISPAGAAAMLRSDPYLNGMDLFKKHCAGCHAYADSDGVGIKLESHSTASNLYGFASRSWISGLLDPNQVGGPRFFGRTAHAKEEEGMVKWVVDTITPMNATQRAEVEKVAIALSAEAKLPAQVDEDARDAAVIAEGKTLFTDTVGCADCHRFDPAGQPAESDDEQLDGPDLTRYGSREWIMRMISDPRLKCNYGDKAEMPAFGDSTSTEVAAGAGSRLSKEEIGLIADWLRGERVAPAK